MSYKFLGEIERGQGNPSIQTIKRLALGLGVEIYDLFVPPDGPGGSEVVYPIGKDDMRLFREAVRTFEDALDRVSTRKRGSRTSRR